MASKNNNKPRPNKSKVVTEVKREKKKKEEILIEVAKGEAIGEVINGFQVIKPVKRFGKYYVLVKNK